MKRPKQPTTTAERLLAVADWIETGEEWDQGQWVRPVTLEAFEEIGGDYGLWDEDTDKPALFETPAPLHVAGQEICGTHRCAAGEAIMLTPEKELRARLEAMGINPDTAWWEEAGSAALGLDPELGEIIFMTIAGPEVDYIAPALRALAKMPEGERNIEAAEKAGLISYVPSSPPCSCGRCQERCPHQWVLRSRDTGTDKDIA